MKRQLRKMLATFVASTMIFALPFAVAVAASNYDYPEYGYLEEGYDYFYDGYQGESYGECEWEPTCPDAPYCEYELCTICNDFANHPNYDYCDWPENPYCDCTLCDVDYKEIEVIECDICNGDCECDEPTWIPAPEILEELLVELEGIRDEALAIFQAIFANKDLFPYGEWYWLENHFEWFSGSMEMLFFLSSLAEDPDDWFWDINGDGSELVEINWDLVIWWIQDVMMMEWGVLFAGDLYDNGFDISLLDGGPTNDGPINDGPINDGPINDGPINDGPINDGPINDGPINDGPINDGPINDSPINDGPINDGPINDGPINDGPINDGPINDGSINDSPINDGPVNDDPVNEEGCDCGPAECCPECCPICYPPEQKEEPATTAPQTGDSASAAPLVISALMSISVFLGGLTSKKKTRH